MKMELSYGSVTVKSERLENQSRTEEMGAFCLNPIVNDHRRNCSSSASYEFARNRSQALHEKKLIAVRKLLNCVQANDFDQLKRLLEHKPDLNVLINGQTVLHYCLLFGRDVSWCKQLITNGANPNLSNLDGWHPIHLAAFNGLQDTLTYLLSVNQHHPF